MMVQARWPNTTPANLLTPGLGVADAGTTATRINDSALPGLNWSNAKVWGGMRYGWTATTGNVTGYGAGFLNVSGFNDTNFQPNPGSLFYVFGTLELLNAASEWHWDGSQLYLKTPALDHPANHLVEVKKRLTVFDLNARQYIEIRGLQLFGGMVTMDGASGNNVLDGITAKYVGHFATGVPYGPNPGVTGIELEGSNNVLKNSDISWSAGNLVLIRGNNHRVENNLLQDADYFGAYWAPVSIDAPGSGGNSSGHKILRNTIKRAGRDGIILNTTTPAPTYQNTTTLAPTYQNIEIAYNDISEYGMLTFDAGAIYSFNVNVPNIQIHHNLLHDAKMIAPTAPEGTWAIVYGLYFDGSSGSTGSATIRQMCCGI